MASGYRYHVAEDNGELAGVVAVRDNRHLPPPRPVRWLIGLL